MTGQTDQQLLRDYSERQTDAAFAELVRRHVDLVYSATLRMVRDAHLAEDVTQAVFIALAQNALDLTARPVLSGWLHRTAQNLAAKAVRTDVRRRAREQEAATMNELLATEPDLSRRSETETDAWAHIAPQLDAALGELSEPDRDAVLLRYFENKSLREVGQALGTSDDTAQKRVSRAVERLREFFAKRGVTVGTSGLVVVISANAVQAAPVGLAVTISTAAALAGTTIAATATATAIKTIAMTTIQKTLITVTIAAVVGAGVYEARQASTSRAEVQTLRQQQAPLGEQILQLTRERDDATRKLAAQRGEIERMDRDRSELLKLRGEVARLRANSTVSSSTSATPDSENDPDRELKDKLSKIMEQANLEFEVEGRLLQMKRALRLTPEQEVAMRSFFIKQRGVNFAAAKALDPEIAALLTPEQKVAADQLIQQIWQNTRTSQILAGAKSELFTMQLFLGLDQNQQDKALPVFVDYLNKIRQEQDERNLADGSNVDIFSDEFVYPQLDALKSILTDEQFAVYRKRQELAMEGVRLLRLHDLSKRANKQNPQRKR